MIMHGAVFYCTQGVVKLLLAAGLPVDTRDSDSQVWRAKRQRVLGAR